MSRVKRRIPMRGVRFLRSTCAFYDAIDKDVANELRQKNPNPHRGSVGRFFGRSGMNPW